MNRSRAARIHETRNEAKRHRLHGAFLVGVSCAVALIAAATGADAQNVPKSVAPMEVRKFKPSLDDLMTMLVQSRHIKLFYAGDVQNWELAGFQVKARRSAFRRVGSTIPRYQSMGVEATMSSMMTPSLQALDAAIKQKKFQAVCECLLRVHHVMHVITT